MILKSLLSLVFYHPLKKILFGNSFLIPKNDFVTIL